MRLTYAVRRSWPARGGIEGYLELFSAELAAEHDVQVVSQRAEDSECGHLREAFLGAGFAAFTHRGVRTDPLRLSATDKLALAPVAVRALAPRLPGPRLDDELGRYGRVIGGRMARAAQRPDILHVMNGGNFAVAALHARRRLGVPLVVTPHAHPGQWDHDEPSGVAYRQADRVVATGEADASVYLGLGVREDRLAIVAPCTAPLPAGGGNALRRAREIGDGPLVLFLGVRRDYKGFDVLLRAAPAVARELPDVSFAFVGPGAPLRASEGARVLDIGPVDVEEKAAWLEAADVVALPSAFESFGLVVAEAWSLGTPVVTSRAPALAELVEAGGGGLAVEREPDAVARALLELLRDPPAARGLGESGRAHWRANHTPERTAARLLELYRGL